MFDDFELRWAKAITAIKLVESEDNLNFRLVFKCGERREVTAANALSKWSKQMFDYFEKCLVNVQRTTIFHGDNIIEERSPTGDPAEVICEFEFQLNLSNCNEYTLMISSAFRC